MSSKIIRTPPTLDQANLLLVPLKKSPKASDSVMSLEVYDLNCGVLYASFRFHYEDETFSI